MLPTYNYRPDKSLTNPEELPDDTAFVLAGCHSLVYLEGKLTGDPMETASLKAIKWTLGSGMGV